MATIVELENDNNTIKAWVSGIKGLTDDLVITVLCEYEPGQPFKRGKDFYDAQEPLDENVEINECYIDLGTIAGVENCRTKDIKLDSAQLTEIAEAVLEHRG